MAGVESDQSMKEVSMGSPGERSTLVGGKSLAAVRGMD